VARYLRYRGSAGSGGTGGSAHLVASSQRSFGVRAPSAALLVNAGNQSSVARVLWSDLFDEYVQVVAASYADASDSASAEGIAATSAQAYADASDSASAEGRGVLVPASYADASDSASAEGIAATAAQAYADAWEALAVDGRGVVSAESYADASDLLALFGFGTLVAVSVADARDEVLVIGVPAYQAVVGEAHSDLLMLCVTQGSAFLRTRMICDQATTARIFARGELITYEPSAERLPFTNGGVLRPNGPVLPRDYMLAPDLKNYPQWKRRRGDEWTNKEQRVLVFDWLRDFFRTRVWARRWDVCEVATSMRSASRLLDVRLVIGITPKSGARIEVAIVFPEATVNASQLSQGLILAAQTLDVLYATAV